MGCSECGCCGEERWVAVSVSAVERRGGLQGGCCGEERGLKCGFCGEER